MTNWTEFWSAQANELTPLLAKMKLDERGIGWHAFKRFRKTWLRGQRCLEDINNFWIAYRPQTMSELYSHLHEELEMRLDEVERAGYGFGFPESVVAANAPRNVAESVIENAA